VIRVSIQAHPDPVGLVGKFMADLGGANPGKFDNSAHQTALLGEGRALQLVVGDLKASPNAIDNQVGNVLRNVDTWVVDAELRQTLHADLADSAGLYRQEYDAR